MGQSKDLERKRESEREGEREKRERRERERERERENSLKQTNKKTPLQNTWHTVISVL